MIKTQDLTVSYDNQVVALEGVNLELAGPTITGIIGPNGAGKSTFVKAILNMVDHDGQVFLDGVPALSGGQFQRVLMARCLVQEADYIFLDEPFTGIDSVSEEIIMKILKDLKTQGKTVLIVHHDLHKVRRYFDQLIIINKQLIAVGPTEQVFNDQNMKAAYGDSVYFSKGGDLV